MVFAMSSRRKNSYRKRNILIGVVLLLVIVSVIVLAYQMNPSSGAPEFSNMSTSSSNYGSPCTFSALWSSSANLSGYVFGSNNTGSFVNDTWTPFDTFVNQTAAYSDRTVALNDTIGNAVSWAFWCNDTKNRWTTTATQNLFVDSDNVLFVIRWLDSTTGNTITGNITIHLFEDMPITTRNFKDIVRTGDYDGTLFHRIARGFVIQGGDLTPKGINWPNITDELPNKHNNTRGTLAMAKTSEPNSANSQFFINLNDSNAASLDSNYSVFGIVTDGMSVADAISLVPITPSSPSNPNDGTPISPVTLVSARFIN